jgi:hypothetical protein
MEGGGDVKRTLHWMLAASVGGAWLTGRAGPDGLRHVGAGLLVALLLALTVLAVVRRGRLGPTRKAALSALTGLGLLLLLAGTGAVVLAGEERWAPSLVGVGTGVRVHAVHEVAAWALVAWSGVHASGALLHWSRNRPSGRVEVGAAALALALSAPVVLGVSGSVPAADAYAGADPTWAAECGDCHLAYPPDLLPARSWTRMMDESGGHFGEDLALAPETSTTIRAWLVARAAERDGTEHAWRIHRTVPEGQAPQRITELDWWAGAHAAVPAEAFDSPEVRTRGRCQACHPDAASGAFQAATTLNPEKSP